MSINLNARSDGLDIRVKVTWRTLIALAGTIGTLLTTPEIIHLLQLLR